MTESTMAEPLSFESVSLSCSSSSSTQFRLFAQVAKPPGRVDMAARADRGLVSGYIDQSVPRCRRVCVCVCKF